MNGRCGGELWDWCIQFQRKLSGHCAFNAYWKKEQFYKVVMGCIIGEAQTMIEKGHFKAKRPKAIQIIIIIIATCLIALNTF